MRRADRLPDLLNTLLSVLNICETAVKAGLHFGELLPAANQLSLDTVQVRLLKLLFLEDLFVLHIPFPDHSGLAGLLDPVIFQLSLVRGNILLQYFLMLLRCLQIILCPLLVRMDLCHSPLNILLLLLQSPKTLLRLVFSVLSRHNVHSCRVLSDEQLLQYGFLLLDRLSDMVSLGLDVLDIRIGCVQPFPCRLRFLFEFLELPSPPQQIGIILEGAAADRTARHEEFSLKRYHPDTVVILSGDPDCIVNVIYHNDAPEHRLCHIPVFCVRPHEGIRQPDRPRLPQHARRPELLRLRDAGQREERSAPKTVSLQKTDHFLRGLLVLRDDILYTSAKSGLDRCLILLVDLDDIRHNADDPPVVLLLFHHLLNAVAKALVPLREVGDRVEL